MSSLDLTPHAQTPPPPSIEPFDADEESTCAHVDTSMA